MIGSKGDQIPDGMIEMWVTHWDGAWEGRKRVLLPFVPREEEQIAVDSEPDQPVPLLTVKRVRTYCPPDSSSTYPDINLLVIG